MKQLLVTLGFALALLATRPVRAEEPFPQPPEQHGWQLAKEVEAIRVWLKEEPGNPLYSLRSDGEIEAPLAQVMRVLLTHERAKEYVGRLLDEHVVRQTSAFDYVEFNGFDLPVLSDRSFCTHVVIRVERDGAVVLESHSIDDPLAPDEGYVRGEIHSLYRLTAIDGGRRTRLEVRMAMDPKGSIPLFIVRLFQKDWPAGVYQGIRKQVLKPDLTDPPNFRALFDRLPAPARR